MNPTQFEQSGFDEPSLASPVIDIDDADEAFGGMVEAAMSEPSASSLASGELPMVVWVRGDEPFATEFFLEADDVMALLGIKRSRLTQISGRELRVGRRRVGRYIRPFYREIDVKAYKEWTRPTAAHTKSREYVDQALHQLQDLGSHLQENLLADMADLKITSDAAWEAEQRNQKIFKARHEVLLSQNKITQSWLQQLHQEQENNRLIGQSLDSKIKNLAELQGLHQQQLQSLFVQILGMQQQIQGLQNLGEALARDTMQKVLDLHLVIQENLKQQERADIKKSSVKFVKKTEGLRLSSSSRQKGGIQKKMRPFFGVRCDF